MTFEEWYDSHIWWKNNRDQWEETWANLIYHLDPESANSSLIAAEFLNDVISLVKEEYGE